MKFFKKLFNLKDTSSEEAKKKEGASDSDNLSIDELFVRSFISKGGKFLYCSDENELKQNLSQILKENKWNNVICFDEELLKLLSEINSAKTSDFITNLPFFTCCETLVSRDGGIMFSTKQLRDKKLKDLPNNFIVYAKTSQIVKTMGEGVSSVRSRAKKNTPTIVSSIKDYLPNKSDTDFMSYGNTNAKTLYLLLLEDL
ncbi:MAG: hypothetical protein ABFR05_05755 [Bacteroidota bacterium]